jgi:hypothetical protein
MSPPLAAESKFIGAEVGMVLDWSREPSAILGVAAVVMIAMAAATTVNFIVCPCVQKTMGIVRASDLDLLSEGREAAMLEEAKHFGNGL